MRWIRWTTRLAIYQRDRWRCVWCGARVSTRKRGRKATLDHIHPRSAGGSNDSRNVVTSCASCNLSRNSKTVGEWLARMLEENHYRDLCDVADRLCRVNEPLDRQAARLECVKRYGRLV